MDSALTRLNACPGKRDLSLSQAAEVLDVCERTIRRMTRPDGTGMTQLGCRRTGMTRKTDRYNQQGHSHKVLIPRVDVVIYLARHHTRPGDFMISLAAQCPEYVPAVKMALAGTPPPAETPPNVIPMHGPRLKRPLKDPYEGHPMLFTA